MHYCYLTNELYPRDKGGIARLIHNIVHHQKQTEPQTRITIVLPAAQAEQRGALSDAFSGIADLVFIRPFHDQKWDFARPAKTPGTGPFHDAFLDGLGAIDALLEVERTTGAPFDVIEVTDHGGLGAFVLRMRAAGQAFQTARIVCRLHSSFSIIAAHEVFEHARGIWAATRMDLERETVETADYCIAHLAAVADANQAHFALTDAWRQRVLVEFPPCLSAQDGVTKTVLATQNAPEFIFASRFQPFKRPELFVLGALAFIQAHPESNATFRMISYAFDPHYIDRIRLMIPPELRSRIVIQTNASQTDRDAALSKGIVVQPSSFESLCVLAYEIAGKGNPILLPRDCVAFAREPRWKDGENCLLFEPTPVGLAETMARALHWRPTASVDTHPDKRSIASGPTTPARHAPLATHVCILPHAGCANAESARVLAQSGVKVTALVHADQSLDSDITQTQDISLVPSHQFAGAHLLEWAQSTGAACIVLTADGYVPSPEFLSLASEMVVPGQTYSANCKLHQQDKVTLQAYPGKSPHVSLYAQDICPPCIAVHISDLHQLVGPEDTRDLMARALARLVAGPLKLILAPLPTVLCFTASEGWANRRNLMGYGQVTNNAGPPLLRLGVDLPSGRNENTLHTESAIWSFSAPDAPEISDGGAVLATQPEPRPYPIRIAKSPLRKIIGLNVAVEPKAPAEVFVSLHAGHNDTESLAAHQNGLQRRKVMPGQKFQLRWGPFEGSLENYTLIVEGAADVQVSISAAQVLTRE